MNFLLMGTNSGSLVCIIMGMVAQADSQLGAFLTVLSPREQLRAKRLAVFVRRHRNFPAVERRRLNDFLGKDRLGNIQLTRHPALALNRSSES